MAFAKGYAGLVAKAERKGRTKTEVDEVIRWLTGYSQGALDAAIERKTDLETFFAEAPAMNPARSLITGTICGDLIARLTGLEARGLQVNSGPARRKPFQSSERWARQ